MPADPIATVSCEWPEKTARPALAPSWHLVVVPVGSVTAATDGMLGKKMPILDFVNVLRPYRKKGIGSKLVVEAINRLVAAGKTPIHCLPPTTESHSFTKALPEKSKQHLRIDTRLVNG
jgi:hypothetical protein